MKQLLLAFYGDDFTGSTDALEFICRAGAKALLFIEPPTAAQLKKYPGLDVYGVAGKTRSLPANEMEAILLRAFRQMKDTNPKHIHYKVCSTFDSSSSVGSIGKAIDCGAEVFNRSFIPVPAGMPALGRYCAFGNLFARMGTGRNGEVYRLDRHPSMSKHPVTPADESDLRLHIGKQTKKTIGLVDFIELVSPGLQGITDKGEVVLIDVLNEDHLLAIGKWMDDIAGQSPLFSVGSSSVEYALGRYWNENNSLTPFTGWLSPGVAEPLLVVSGSCSPVTAVQIAYAKSVGFEELVIDVARTCNETEPDQKILSLVIESIQQQKSVVLHTGNKEAGNQPAEKLGTALGKMAKEVATKTSLKRVVVAGGDTSSYAARAMEIEAVEMIAPIVIGAPLCRAFSNNKYINGLEVNFKGGQVGEENYFELVRKGEV